MKELQPGLYERLIDRELDQALGKVPPSRVERARVDRAEAPKTLADYAARVLEHELDVLSEQGGDARDQEALVNAALAAAGAHLPAGGGGWREEPALDEDTPPEQLLSIAASHGAGAGATRGERARQPRPQSSIATSTLFTGARDEPSLISEIRAELASCERADLLVSFIKWNGFLQLRDPLKDFVGRGGRLRVITTTYMGATDYRAVECLRALPNTQVRISFDAGRARMHAKAYIFVRKTGYTCAYVGSSNISVPALTSGLEWNVKVGVRDQPETLSKILATFESYWANERDFVAYDESQRERLRQELDRDKAGTPQPTGGFSFDIRPYPFQQAVLDRLEAERKVRGNWRNLVVAATGTGKTVMSAFDYRRFCTEGSGVRGTRLLFVAHREEILRQSLDCFRGVLRDENFGDLFVAGHEPASLDHVFVSIQTLNSRHLVQKLPPDYYDFIVVDEFHHAAARSYHDLLDHFTPRVLLGLTATPERLDGQDVTRYFGGRTAAEIRLPEAIDRRLLCPFQYFGVTDSVDLSSLSWSRGGYVVSELDNVYVYSRERALRRARLVHDALLRYVRDVREVCGLGFCVSVEHARFMAEQFCSLGIPSTALSAKTPEDERSRVRHDLEDGRLTFVFVVDLYNEGVDIPKVNTILFLRPTQSLTVFLQQLGRGLRNCEGKDCLTVLDFVGQANRHYDYAGKFEALLGPTHKGIAQEVRDGFPSVPKGCFVQLERKAQDYVLDNISSAFRGRSALVARIEEITRELGHAPSLREFLERTGLDARAIYKTKDSYTGLCAAAGVCDEFAADTATADLTKALPRIAAIDSRRWLGFLMRLLAPTTPLGPEEAEGLTPMELSWAQMFQVTLRRESLEHPEAADLYATPLAWVSALRQSPLHDELLELLAWDLDQIDFVDEPVVLRGCAPDGGDFECPIDLHCRYSRDQVLVALGFMRPTTSREGVKWLPELRCDVLFNTLDKAEKDYSPTTMYRDYSVSESLFHWQSQSTTSEGSQTGQRYIHHAERGSHVLLFVRERDRDAYGNTAPLTFLGLARYVSHEGSRPMSILWHLERPIPAKFLGTTQRLVA